MARATAVDSTWIGELSANVSIGGSSVVLTTTSGTNWPSGAGIFGVQVGEDPDTDAELCQVTRSGSTLTLDASTLTKAHTAGASIYYLTTAPDINAKQDSDSDLTAIAALTPANNDFLQRKSGAWTNRTPTQAQADIAAVGDFSPSGRVIPQGLIIGAEYYVDYDPGAPLVVPPNIGIVNVYPTTAGVPITLQMADPVVNGAGMIVLVQDAEGGAAANPITLTSEDVIILGNTINQGASVTINTNWGSALLVSTTVDIYGTFHADWKTV